MKNPTLYYFHDPMCSWCWAFKPQWDLLCANIPPAIDVDLALGGLAPDTNEPMPPTLQDAIQGYWRTIQDKHGTQFNFDFWTQSEPKRSTWIACRAVIAATLQAQEHAMIKAIQEAYYLRAMNPSDSETLIKLAVEIGLNAEQFTAELNSESTQKKLEEQMAFTQACGVSSFPSLRLIVAEKVYEVPIDIDDYQCSIDRVEQVLKG